MRFEISGKKLMEYVPDYVLFDLETTGLSTEFDEVVEISALKVKDGMIIDEFSTLVNPGKPISEAASEVNGITQKMVQKSPAFDEVLYDFLKFVGNNVIVGHNIERFDLQFILRDAKKYYGILIENDYIDTLQLARIYLPELSSHGLSSLAEHYHISTKGAHRALADCKMNQRIFESLKEEIANPSEAARNVKRCPKCGNVLMLRHGKYGDFYGCAGYPVCSHTENVGGL